MLRELMAKINRSRQTRALTAAVLLIAVVAAGYGVYRIPQVYCSFNRGVDECKGVLPLPATEFVQGEFLLKFKPGTPAEARQSANSQSKADQLDEIPGIGVARMKVPTGSSVGEMVNLYGKNPNVQYAEPNYIRGAADAPNDTYYANQWNLSKLGFPAAWDISAGSASVVIAIVDSGIDIKHDEFAGKYAANPGIDDNGHGTEVSGVAAANTGNAKGLASICRLCTIMSVKVLNSTGSGSDSGVAAGIVKAADGGAKVINLSLGNYSLSQTVQDSVNYAWSKGAVLVGGAGNDNVSNMFYPAALSNVIAVGATTSSDTKSSISNFGSWVKLWAPGQGILSPKMGNTYSLASGTSLAAPHVSGVAGLLFSASPGISNQQVVNFIMGNTDTTTAGPRVNACKALKAAVPSSPVTCGSATTTTAPTPTPTTTLQQSTVATATATSAATATPTATTATAATATPTPVPPTPTATTAAAAATATPTPAPPTPTATTAAATPKTESFTGTVSATGTAQREHTITVAAAGTVSASLGGWSGNPNNNNLDLYLLDGSGAVLTSAVTSNRPETLSFNVTAPGTYTLRVVARAGSGNYTLSVTHP